MYVKYRREDDAEAAFKNLSKRFYAQRPIIAEYSPVTDFREACCRQFNYDECNRGGECHFMHLKKSSLPSTEIYLVVPLLLVKDLVMIPPAPVEITPAPLNDPLHENVVIENVQDLNQENVIENLEKTNIEINVNETETMIITKIETMQKKVENENVSEAEIIAEKETLIETSIVTLKEINLHDLQVENANANAKENANETENQDTEKENQENQEKGKETETLNLTGKK